MKDKLKWNQKKPMSRVVPDEEKRPFIEKIEALRLDASEIGGVSLNKVEEMLSVLEEYYAQFGIVQICLEMEGYGEAKRVAEFYEIGLRVECEETMQIEKDGWIRSNNLLCTTTIYRSDIFDRDEDNYEKAAAFGRNVYYALRKNHPSLTRDLGEPCGANPRPDKYEIVCKSCGSVRRRARKCKITEHPERFKCTCGGKLVVRQI